MKIKSLALLICAVLPSFSTLAENTPIIQVAWQGNSYQAIMVKMKAASSLTRKQLPALLGLDDPSLSINAAFQRATARGVEISELQSMDAKYGFDRYLRITIPEDKTSDIAFINNIVNELKQNSHVETVYPESAPISLDKGVEVNKITKQLKQVDYRSLQYYTKGPQETASAYTLGGVNRDSVNQYEGHDGSNVTIVSHELGMWNQDHINLPKADFILGTPYDNYALAQHDTASVGVMAATDIGAGVRGLAWNTHMAYAAAGSDQLYNAIPKLQAGDVVQIGFQVSGGQATGCTSECYLPLESQQAYFDVIKALTDKGVHVIEAASNGNVNLDHSGLGGIFNLSNRDSGAIIAGAIDPTNSKRAIFSDYGSRVTSASWGYYVTTTGYGDLARPNENAYYTWQFSGTSSANPIIAGAVASLSSIAKAHGTTVTPRQMRDILNQTGTVLADSTSSEIGTQPDMGRAIEKILNLEGGNNENTDNAFINALKMTISSTNNGSSITFNGNVTSDTSATSAPTYRWALPAGAQGSNSGLANQSFTINKTSQPQTLSVNVTVNAGSQSRVLTQTITVPALSSNINVAPVISVDRSTINAVATSNEWSYPVVASSDQSGVSWQWQFISGNSNIRLDNASASSTAFRVPANAGNTQARYRVTATNSNGKSSTSEVAIVVTQPTAVIVGLSTMNNATPDKLYPQANFEQANYSWRLLKGGQVVANGIDQNGQVKTGLPAGDYVTEVTATSSTTGTRSATVTRDLKVIDENVQNNDAAYINSVMMTLSARDNGNSISFSSMIVAGSPATNAPKYNWTLPAEAEGGSNGAYSQIFTVNKTSQPQTLTLSVIVTAGTHSRVLSKTLTVPAKTGGEEVQNNDAAFVNALKMAISSTDNGSSVTFNGSATSGTAATSTPTYRWALPAGAQGSNSGLANQSFTITKTSQAQTLSVNVTVNAGSQSRVLTQTITVPAKDVVNTDAAFINALKMAVSSTDNGSSVTFNGSATSGTAATSTPTYSWALPAGAQGSNSGLATQSFTVNKTSQVQTLSVNVTVNAGSQSRVLTQTITVPAKEVVNTDAAFINGLKMALSSTDNGSSVTFNGSATSGTAATSTPAYRWALPAGAQDSNSGLANQSFTVNKTSQAQTLSLNVTVKAGSQSRVLTQSITVPALVNTGGYPAWVYGSAYKTGDIVSHKGKNYQCVIAGWCSQTGQYSQLHYEPGVGLSWTSAWKLKN